MLEQPDAGAKRVEQSLLSSATFSRTLLLGKESLLCLVAAQLLGGKATMYTKLEGVDDIAVW